jgi:Tol biopolymer transport system component
MVLFSDEPPGTKDTWGMTRRLYTYDRTTGRRAEVAEVPENATVFCCCWSPDGRKIAYTWRQRHADLVKKESLSGPDVTVETEMFLIVADADGRNARTVASVKTDNATAIPFRTIDWR